MSVPFAVTRPRRDLRSVVLVSLIALFSMAFLVLPGAVATISSGPDALTTGTLAETLDGAFSQWWSTGETNLTPDMQSIVSFWEVFHVGKLVISAGLLTVLLLAGARLLQAYSGSERRGRRAGIAIIGALGAPWVALLLLVVLANIQGAMSPLSSVMGLLPMGVPSEAVLEVRTHFANGTTTPILGILIEDFRNYHAVLRSRSRAPPLWSGFVAHRFRVKTCVFVACRPSSARRSRLSSCSSS